ncbi:hypothetical protein [Nonomuraea sp. NPDC048826]|uniref:hypothetical protein n=1 Tax=Nonomuraea sp. NPDC048826 TaxID=3364347 RepID=UPI003713BE6F
MSQTITSLTAPRGPGSCGASPRARAATTELARRTGASLSNASRHAQVLHASGLITSTRQANMMVHEISGLGARLVRCERHS